MIVSEGSPATELSSSDLAELFAQFLAAHPLDGRKVLAIIPDDTRSGPTGTFFRVISDALMDRAAKIDFLIALGTHPPMAEEDIDRLLDMSAGARRDRYASVGVFNHHWSDPDQLREIGRLERDFVRGQTGGMIDRDVPVRLNRMIFDYDHLLICGPVFPHEVAGFSGGHKYLFPGIAAPQIINFTHWVGALQTNPVINGNRENPVRATIEAAADLVPIERSLFAYVVEGRAVRGVFGGPVREAWRAATELSDQLHVVYHEEPFRTVLACAPTMYHDIWTAGKCMYKLEPVVADGGTLIIHAPHITELSYSHGRVLDEIGYHVRDYFVGQWDRFRDQPWGVIAHSTHVKGIGTFEAGVETPRVNVVLATGIPEERCRKVNLGYMDPASIHPDDYAGREKEGILMVPQAGETLFRLKDMSRFNAAAAGA